MASFEYLILWYDKLYIGIRPWEMSGFSLVMLFVMNQVKDKLCDELRYELTNLFNDDINTVWVIP